MRLELAHGVYDGRQLIASAALDGAHIPLMALGTNPVSGDSYFYGQGWNTEFTRHGLAWGSTSRVWWR